MTDDAGTRTWFAWLGAAPDQLTAIDLTPLLTARLSYVDCYRIIDTAAAAITASRAPLLLSLGSRCALRHRGRHHEQPSRRIRPNQLDEANSDRAEQLADDLYARIVADTIVITLGRLGVFACAATATYRADTPSMTVRHTHGAGAAFSGGLAHAHLTGATTAEGLRAAGRIGAAHCASADHLSFPTQI